MYRGRPPSRGGYLPSYDSRGPPPPRFHAAAGYRDDRDRARAPYHLDYHSHAPPDLYPRSPPRRRYPSPGPVGHRGGEYWAGGPPRERSASPHAPAPLNHKLVITVGNELTGSSDPRHHDRDHNPRKGFQYSYSQDRSPDRSRARSRGRSKSRPRSRSRSRGHSKNRPRSRSRSRSRSRGRSKGRARSRSRGRSKSRLRSRSRSRGRSKSRHRSRSWSRGRSKSRHRSRSRSRSRGRSYGRALSRGRSVSRSSSSSRSSSHDAEGADQSEKDFRELETARRKKELEEMLSLAPKSILKRRGESSELASVKSADSPSGAEGSNMSRVTQQLLAAFKGLEPHKVALMLSELQADPQMAERAGLDADIQEVLQLLGRPSEAPAKEAAEDILDEEEFLYGGSERPRSPTVAEQDRHQSLDLYSEVTEDTLYRGGDYHPQRFEPSSQQQATPTPAETEARCLNRPTTVAQSKSSHLPGMEPLEEGERQALEEYEKIQDLLKTIGLDLGVAEIGKMAARTKERLQGHKKAPSTKTPTRRRRDSSGSSGSSGRSRGRKRHSRRRSSSSSSSRSSSSGSSRGRSWSGDHGGEEKSAPPPSIQDQEMKVERSGEPHPPHCGEPIPTFPPPPHVPAVMAPNYPPPPQLTSYGQYTNYLPYMHQQWQAMFPPPNMGLPHQPHQPHYPPVLPYGQATSESGVKDFAASHVQDGEDHQLHRRTSEEENNQSQKQKVLEEREKLREERDARMKKKEYLIKELETLKKQQGELLRKKRREKGGHKDPLLQEISRLQEEVMSQISSLRREHLEAEKKRTEIDAVALILGLSPSDRPRKSSQSSVRQEKSEQEEKPRLPDRSRETAKSPERHQQKTTVTVTRSSLDQEQVVTVQVPPPEPFEYYDAGNHWCRNCNVTSGSMFDFFTHLHSKTHRKTLDPYDRPWASSTATKNARSLASEENLTKPAKGSEFLLPIRGFFCVLCQEFYGDAICAEEHVTKHCHNEKYKKQMCKNPLYEQRRNLDRQAGLSADASAIGKKHKLEEDEDNGAPDKEGKFKPKKPKKDRESNSAHMEDKSKIQDRKSLESDDKHKHGKKDEKYRERRRDEDERYSQKEEFRYHHHREERGRYPGAREDQDKYKPGKHPDSKGNSDREQDKGKLKGQKDQGKVPTKAETAKLEPPSKPYEPPKIMCGPSPAMRAKLRKQNQEACKAAPAAPITAFGKFMWKKKENVLAKEAQKAAVEFLKEDEALLRPDAKQDDEVDPFMKSLAFAKQIAERLGGLAPPIRGQIRPNLPGPSTVQRGTSLMGKPAPLNAFLSLGTESTSSSQPPTSKDDPIFAEPAPPKPIRPALLATPFTPPPHPTPTVPSPKVFPQAPVPFMQPRSDPVVLPKAAVVATCVARQAAPPSVFPLATHVKSEPPHSQDSKPAPQKIDCAPEPVVAKATAPEAKKVTPEAKPSPVNTITIVPDVAAPGVPESEQTQVVFIKPPPVVTLGDGARRAEKPRSSLAAAKAQDLLGIWYSSIGQTSSTCITRPASSSNNNTTDAFKKQSCPADATKPPVQSKAEPRIQSQPPALNTRPGQEVCDGPPAAPDIQIASVGSLEPKLRTEASPSCTIEPPSLSPNLQPSPQSLADISLPATALIQQKTPPSFGAISITETIPPQAPQSLQPSLQPKVEVSPPATALIQQKTAPSCGAIPITEPVPSQAPQNLQPSPQSEVEVNPPAAAQSPEQTPMNLVALAAPSLTEPESQISDVSKVSPKSKGRKNSSPSRPVRQTRSQTRYQTRQLQQSQSEPEPDSASGESDTGASELKQLPEELGHPVCGLQTEEVEEVPPETLNLPSHITSLDFTSDLNFE